MDRYDGQIYHGANGQLFKNARELRISSTEAEKLLWENLRNRRLNGLKFRRQHPISQFVADFYCNDRQLVVELDGDIHNEKEVNEYDKGRTFELEKLGLMVIRFRNEEVLSNVSEVLRKILEATALNPPSPDGEGPGVR